MTFVESRAHHSALRGVVQARERMMMENPENVRIPERLREIAFSLRADEAWNEASWIDAAADEIERLRSMTMDWRKIESLDALPKGDDILVAEPWEANGEFIYHLAYWEEDYARHATSAFTDIPKKATHWCPITPPEADT